MDRAVQVFHSSTVPSIFHGSYQLKLFWQYSTGRFLCSGSYGNSKGRIFRSNVIFLNWTLETTLIWGQYFFYETLMRKDLTFQWFLFCSFFSLGAHLCGVQSFLQTWVWWLFLMLFLSPKIDKEHHGTSWVGSDLRDHHIPIHLLQVGLSAAKSGTRIRLPRASSNPALNTPMDRASTTLWATCSSTSPPW